MASRNTDTIPARDSVEEAWFQDVRRGAKTIAQVTLEAERRRELRNLSAARLMGGGSEVA